jgi:hypothetical protein
LIFRELFLYEKYGDETADMAYLIAFVLKNNWLNFEVPNFDECLSVSKIDKAQFGICLQYTAMNRRGGGMMLSVGR